MTGLKRASLHYLAVCRNRSRMDFLYAAVPDSDCSCSWLSGGVFPERGQKHRGVPTHAQARVPQAIKP